MNYMEHELARALALWRGQERLLADDADGAVPESAAPEPVRPEQSLSRRNAVQERAAGEAGHEAQAIDAAFAAPETGGREELPGGRPAAETAAETFWEIPAAQPAREQALALSERLERDARRYDSMFLLYR